MVGRRSVGVDVSSCEEAFSSESQEVGSMAVEFEYSTVLD
jgi:hypothetical protein